MGACGAAAISRGRSIRRRRVGRDGCIARSTAAAEMRALARNRVWVIAGLKGINRLTTARRDLIMLLGTRVPEWSNQPATVKFLINYKAYNMLLTFSMMGSWQTGTDQRYECRMIPQASECCSRKVVMFSVKVTEYKRCEER